MWDAPPSAAVVAPHVLIRRPVHNIRILLGGGGEFAPADGQPHADVEDNEGQERKEEEEEEGSLKEEFWGLQRRTKGRLLSYIAMERVTERRFLVEL